MSAAKGKFAARIPRLNMKSTITNLLKNPAWTAFFNTHRSAPCEFVTPDISEIFHATTLPSGIMFIAAFRDESLWPSSHWPDWYLAVIDPSTGGRAVIEGSALEVFSRFGALPWFCKTAAESPS